MSTQGVLKVLASYSNGDKCADLDNTLPVCGVCWTTVNVSGWWRSRAALCDVCDTCYGWKRDVDRDLDVLFPPGVPEIVAAYWHPAGWSLSCRQATVRGRCSIPGSRVYHATYLTDVRDRVEDSNVCEHHLDMFLMQACSHVIDVNYLTDVQDCEEDSNGWTPRPLTSETIELRRVVLQLKGPLRQNDWQRTSLEEDCALCVVPEDRQWPRPWWGARPVRGNMVLPVCLCTDEAKVATISRLTAERWPAIWGRVDWVLPQGRRRYFDLRGSIETIRAWVLFDEISQGHKENHYALVCCDTGSTNYGNVLLCCTYWYPSLCVVQTQMTIETYLQIRAQLWRTVSQLIQN